MWPIIPSLDGIVQPLAVVFTCPTYVTYVQVLIGWLMCSGRRTEYRVFETINADHAVSAAERHPFDRFYNFFSRSAWKLEDLTREVAIAVVVGLNRTGLLYLVVDDTLLHKRGKHVYGLGWFRDAVASTAKRVATASGNNWVVVGLAIRVPFCPIKIYCLPLMARLHIAGENTPGCAELAAEMMREIVGWFPDRQFVLIGDGAYAAGHLLKDLDERIVYVGRMRADAELYGLTPPKGRQGKRGPKPQKGGRLPSPAEAVKKADRKQSGKGASAWQELEVSAYGVTRTLKVLTYLALWPRVTGLKPVRVIIVRDPEGQLDDTYLFTTDVTAELAWVVATYARRWSIEVAFRSSKQVLGIQSPQHWCQGSIEKLAPWVWLTQSIVALWYLTAGHALPEAETAREQMSPWEDEYSLRHMVRVLRHTILEDTIQRDSTSRNSMRELIELFKNCIRQAA